jgi:hypothetical protein
MLRTYHVMMFGIKYEFCASCLLNRNPDNLSVLSWMIQYKFENPWIESAPGLSFMMFWHKIHEFIASCLLNRNP